MSTTETLRDQAAREASEGVGRKCFDERLLHAFVITLYTTSSHLTLTPEQARVLAKLDEIFERGRDGSA